MKINLTLTALLLGTALLASCASDPLAKAVKKAHFAPLSPVRKTQFINDIYHESSPHSDAVLLRQNLSAEQRAVLAQLDEDHGPQSEIVLPGGGTEKTYKLDLAVDVIGQASGTLATAGARKYSVKFGKVIQFTSSDDDFETRFALIKSFRPEKQYEGKFAISGLLLAESLEYTFYRENDTKIEIKPGTALSTTVTGQLGVGWTSKQDSTLTFTSPHYIGYRMAKLSNTGIARDKRKKAAFHAALPPGEKPPVFIATEVPMKDLRKAD